MELQPSCRKEYDLGHQFVHTLLASAHLSARNPYFTLPFILTSSGLWNTLPTLEQRRSVGRSLCYCVLFVVG